MRNAKPRVGLRGYRILDPARAAARRTAVIQAGARVFSAKGYHDATMDDIALEMGVSKGVLYYQFRSKEEVFTEIMTVAIAEALKLLTETTSRSGSPADRLRAGIRQLIAFNLEETTPGYYSKMVSRNLRGISDVNRERIRTLQRAYQRVVVDLIREGQVDGIFEAGDASVTAMNILTAANGVSDWFVSGRRASAEDVADQVSAQLIHGILTTPMSEPHAIRGQP